MIYDNNCATNYVQQCVASSINVEILYFFYKVEEILRHHCKQKHLKIWKVLGNVITTILL